MVKSTVKILREFYREQDKEVDRSVDPDDDTTTLVRILSVPNPIVRIAKRRKLSFTTIEGNSIVVVNPDNTRTSVGTIENKDVPVTERSILFQ